MRKAVRRGLVLLFPSYFAVMYCNASHVYVNIVAFNDGYLLTQDISHKIRANPCDV